MTTELIVRFKFNATHSLAPREEPHPHLWRVCAVIRGTPQHGFILDLMRVRQAFAPQIEILTGTYLNSNTSLSAEAQTTPTCEALASHFFSRLDAVMNETFRSDNPTAALFSVEVELDEPGGFEWGAAKLQR